jgi:biofilm PGA synthesis lipoprotein PgaB
MSRRLFILIVIVFIFNLTVNVFARGMKPGEFMVLAYHVITEKAVPGDVYSVPQSDFTEQMEYLRTHGYHPVSMDDIIKASEGEKTLPEKPVLLTFDDAYISYYNFVVPMLEKLGYPSVLSVIGSFVGNSPKGLTEPLMNWDQIREVAAKELVDVVSHTYDLHKSVQYNPPGNIGSAVSVFAYDPEAGVYETEKEYTARIKADFDTQTELFKKELGTVPRAVVWPFGRHNAISWKIANASGCRLAFKAGDRGLAHLERLNAVNRLMIEKVSIEDFIQILKTPDVDDTIVRAVQVDLDLIYDSESYEKTDENLGKLIERLVEMKVNTVYLQAFADPEGTGNIESVYFHNRVLPVRADIFSHAVHQMIIRGIYVYAWMPVLSIMLPDEKLNSESQVIERVKDKTGTSKSQYRRLTPFSNDIKILIRNLYEDLASHAQINGVLFNDDAFLTDNEDFNPQAVASYKERFGKNVVPEDLGNNSEFAKDWTRFKTETLIGFTKNLMGGVRKYRPSAKYARNIYSKLLTEPETEEWFAQNFGLFLQAYDQVVIMAYPQMEKVRRPSLWFKGLVNTVKEFPGGIEKTIFKVQTYDWGRQTWIKDKVIFGEMQDILASGGKHIAYYPDNFWENKPSLDTVKLEMSTEKYPFMP